MVGHRQVLKTPILCPVITPGQPANLSINSRVQQILLVLPGALLVVVSVAALHYGKCAKPFLPISAKGASACLEKIQQPLSGGQTLSNLTQINFLSTNLNEKKDPPLRDTICDGTSGFNVPFSRDIMFSLL